MGGWWGLKVAQGNSNSVARARKGQPVALLGDLSHFFIKQGSAPAFDFNILRINVAVLGGTLKSLRYIITISHLNY